MRYAFKVIYGIMIPDYVKNVCFESQVKGHLIYFFPKWFFFLESSYWRLKYTSNQCHGIKKIHGNSSKFHLAETLKTRLLENFLEAIIKSGFKRRLLIRSHTFNQTKFIPGIAMSGLGPAACWLTHKRIESWSRLAKERVGAVRKSTDKSDGSKASTSLNMSTDSNNDSFASTEVKFQYKNIQRERQTRCTIWKLDFPSNWCLFYICLMLYSLLSISIPMEIFN